MKSRSDCRCMCHEPGVVVRHVMPCCQPDPDPERTVPAESFLATVNANVDNDKLYDADFRQFIRNSLPIVVFPRPKKDDQ